MVFRRSLFRSSSAGRRVDDAANSVARATSSARLKPEFVSHHRTYCRRSSGVSTILSCPPELRPAISAHGPQRHEETNRYPVQEPQHRSLAPWPRDVPCDSVEFSDPRILVASPPSEWLGSRVFFNNHRSRVSNRAGLARTKSSRLGSLIATRHEAKFTERPRPKPRKREALARLLPCSVECLVSGLGAVEVSENPGKLERSLHYRRGAQLQGEAAPASLSGRVSAEDGVEN